MSDSVVERAKRGDHQAMEAIYRNHVSMVYGYLNACGAPDPEDLTSEVFVGVLRGISNFHGDAGDFRTWIMSIAYRRLVDRRRGRSLMDLHEPNSLLIIADPEPPAFVIGEMDPRLIQAFGELTQAQREVLALRFVADLALEQVAEVTSRPVGAVKSLQHRALNSLRAALDAQVERASREPKAGVAR